MNKIKIKLKKKIQAIKKKLVKNSRSQVDNLQEIRSREFL